MEYYKTELKTGAVVLFCLALLISLIVGISGTKTLGKTYTFVALFKNIGGLETDAPVDFSGFEVGNVKAIRLTTAEEKKKNPDYNVAVTMKLASDAIVRKNSVIQIKTVGYLGLKYIDISAGTFSTDRLADGEMILGYTPQDINEIIEFVGSTLKELKPKVTNILNGIQNLVGESGSITVTVDELNKLIHNADDVITVNKEDLRNLIANLNQASTHLKAFSADIEDNPWKLLIKSKKKDKTKSKTPSTRTKSRSGVKRRR